MAEKPTMPTPVDAPLLIDDPEHGDRDERFDDVHLLEVDEDGEGKTTAQRVRGGWRIADWELTEELEGALGGARYWFCRSFHTVPDVHVVRLAELQAAEPRRVLAPSELLYCRSCSDAQGHALAFHGGETVRDLTDGPGCPKCGRVLDDLPF